MQLRISKLEKELNEFKEEFKERELTSFKFKELLMADDNIEE
ncbi:MAG: hypothetical protein ACTSPW_12290 [Promethearchaeota archaeon]